MKHQISLPNARHWPTALQVDFAVLEKKIETLMVHPMAGEREEFADYLRKAEKNLFYKWLYNGKLTNVERDTIAIVARRFRKAKGE